MMIKYKYLVYIVIFTNLTSAVNVVIFQICWLTKCLPIILKYVFVVIKCNHFAINMQFYFCVIQ